MENKIQPDNPDKYGCLWAVVAFFTLSVALFLVLSI